MRARVLILALVFCAASAVAQAKEREKLVIHFFGSSACAQCLEIIDDILKPVAAEFPDEISLHIHDIKEPEGFQLMMRMEEAHEVPETSPQELYVGNSYILGYEAIKAQARKLIADYLNHPVGWKTKAVTVDETLEHDLRKRIRRFTFLGVLAAGLVDGINPCAIATVIFLVSFLARQRRPHSQVLVVGLTFTGAVYLTYLLLGVGAFKALTALSLYRWLSTAIRWSAVAFAGAVGVLSFWDAAAYKRTGDTGEITLQLPKPVKLRIHRIISDKMTASHLVTGAVVTGVLVTLLEAVCTGQVYLPTIILMTRASGLRLEGWLYLLFYNFLFVLPLLVITVFAYRGLTWNKLAKLTQRHLTLLKILLGVVMFGLAAFLAVS
jgi:cytochrome c biogenesis protein CcdA